MLNITNANLFAMNIKMCDGDRLKSWKLGNYETTLVWLVWNAVNVSVWWRKSFFFFIFFFLKLIINCHLDMCLFLYASKVYTQHVLVHNISTSSYFPHLNKIFPTCFLCMRMDQNESKTCFFFFHFFRYYSRYVIQSFENNRRQYLKRMSDRER